MAQDRLGESGVLGAGMVVTRILGRLEETGLKTPPSSFSGLPVTGGSPQVEKWGGEKGQALLSPRVSFLGQLRKTGRRRLKSALRNSFVTRPSVPQRIIRDLGVEGERVRLVTRSCRMPQDRRSS